jgi:hypothetical protein
MTQWPNIVGAQAGAKTLKQRKALEGPGKAVLTPLMKLLMDHVREAMARTTCRLCVIVCFAN